jgi:glycosyltransferase involved in cell wall biosynthesis
MVRAEMRLWVVVPFFNEARLIAGTLGALANQSDPEFEVVLVDNASTDDSLGVVRTFMQRTPAMRIEVIAEAHKGTGAASDTGFRHAIASGASHVARVDADCLPDADWVRNLKSAFTSDGLEFVAGKIKPRTDDVHLTAFDRRFIPALVSGAERLGRLRRRGPQFKYPYILAVGSNLAITAELYLRAGGFPRASIEQVHEDRALSERVRTLTARGGVRTNVVVYCSARRAKRYGYLRTALWYIAHWCRPRDVDVR